MALGSLDPSTPKSVNGAGRARAAPLWLTLMPRATKRTGETTVGRLLGPKDPGSPALRRAVLAM